VSDFTRYSTVSRWVVCIGVLAAVLVVAQIVQRRHVVRTQIADSAVLNTATLTAEPTSPTIRRPNEHEILAGCHPHLGPHSTVLPKIDLSRIGNPAGAILKARFWINGNGFVVQSYVDGFSIYTPADQEAALDFIKTLVFEVPNTPECNTRKIELSGKFFQTRNSSGEWETALDVYPRYSFDGTQLVVKP
jgi:hypothetical protein